MDLTEARTLVRDTIDSHYGITHLRLESSGSFTGAVGVSVTTLARPEGGRRTRGTREQTIVHRDAGPWLAAFATLAPQVPIGSGCASRSTIDVDRDGAVTVRRRG